MGSAPSSLQSSTVSQGSLDAGGLQPPEVATPDMGNQSHPAPEANHSGLPVIDDSSWIILGTDAGVVQPTANGRQDIVNDQSRPATDVAHCGCCGQSLQPGSSAAGELPTPSAAQRAGIKASAVPPQDPAPEVNSFCCGPCALPESTRPEPPAGITQLNESVYQLYCPSDGDNDLEIIFVHGLQISDHKEAYWKTWRSRHDETVVWPKDWLSQAFPRARILSIAYESSVWAKEGEPDPEDITDTLITDMLTHERVGQKENCPVILVGHSLGGIIIKRVIIRCSRMKEELPLPRNQIQVDRVERFLRNCKGVVFFSTPHAGSQIADYVSKIPTTRFNQGLLKLLRMLNNEAKMKNMRLFESFEGVRQNNDIKCFSIGERLKTQFRGLNFLVVDPWSAVSHNDQPTFFRPEANHFNVCRPENNRTCRIFLNFVAFIDELLPRLHHTHVPLRRDESSTGTESSQQYGSTMGSPLPEGSSSNDEIVRDDQQNSEVDTSF